MISMQSTARRPQRGEADNLSQPLGIVHLWWLLLGVFTLLIVLVPGLRVTFHHEALSFTLETFNAIVATMVSFVGLARYVFERRPFDLAIAAGVRHDRRHRALVWPDSSLLRLHLPVGGRCATLGLAAHSTRRRRSAAAGPARLGARPTAPGAGGWSGGPRRRRGGRGGRRHLVLEQFPAAPARVRAWEVFEIPGRITTSVLAGQTALGMLLESLVAALYFWLAYRLTLAVRHGEDAWLALAIITAAIAEFQFIFYPAPFHPAITTSDLLWLVSYILLLAYLGHQYVRASGSMRRQQTRTRALLALSQTPVVSRDPSLVLTAARDATKVVGNEATVKVSLGEGASSPDRLLDGVTRVPVALDGVRYGSFDVYPVDGQNLHQDTEEYLRVVANQTANLLRSIDLYHELSRGAVRDERAQLARELHDGLAQDLAVLRLRLSGELDGTYEHGLADRALAEARYAITILRGQTAAPADFFEALRRQSEDLADRFDCPVIVEQEDQISGISGAAQVALLRICREAVANAGKHGKPSRIVLTVRQVPDAVEVEIADDGTGFDTLAPIRAGAYGLKGMAERASLLGGEFNVRSQPGDGTTVTVRLPNSEEGTAE